MIVVIFQILSPRNVLASQINALQWVHAHSNPMNRRLVCNHRTGIQLLSGVLPQGDRAQGITPFT
jgi:hypothetical protein